MGIRMLSGSAEDMLDNLEELGCDEGSETSRMLELGDGRYIAFALGIEPTVLGSRL